MCLNPFVQRNKMTTSTKFTFDFLNIAESFWILIFCTQNKSRDESQSKAQFNLQSVGEN